MKSTADRRSARSSAPFLAARSMALSTATNRLVSRSATRRHEALRSHRASLGPGRPPALSGGMDTARREVAALDIPCCSSPCRQGRRRHRRRHRARSRAARRALARADYAEKFLSILARERAERGKAPPRRFLVHADAELEGRARRSAGHPDARGAGGRQIYAWNRSDTETTGLDPAKGDRVVESARRRSGILSQLAGAFTSTSIPNATCPRKPFAFTACRASFSPGTRNFRSSSTSSARSSTARG